MSDLPQIATILLTMVIMVDPLGLIPIYLSLTGGMETARKRQIMMKATLTALVVLIFFVIAGQPILAFLGIKPGSFYIAGGILFFIVSLDLLLGHPQRTKHSDREHDRDTEGGAVFPLGVPILAGPGTITTIIIFSVETSDPIFTGALLLGSVVVALGICVVTMLLSDSILRVLRQTGVSVIQRLMGLILSGLAVQFVYDGLVRLNVLSG